jgi:hypothetical protein
MAQAIVVISCLIVVCTTIYLTVKFKISTQSTLAFIGILAVLFSLNKILLPNVKIKIISFYSTLDKEYKAIFILKIQTISNVDLMLDEIIANVKSANGQKYQMNVYSPRMKGVIFKMHDLADHECDYALQKPLEPDLRICGIKRGNNECYICLKSLKKFEDSPIESWIFELKWRQPLLPVPNVPYLNRKVIIINHPPGKDLFWDDLLFKKISSEERENIINNL